MKREKNYKHIIWDWNGTLLGDVDFVIYVMNRLLLRRGLTTIDYEKYRNFFDFPVIDYYSGLDLTFLLTHLKNWLLNLLMNAKPI